VELQTGKGEVPSLSKPVVSGTGIARFLRRHDLLALTAVYGMLCALVPLDSAVELAQDEHFEVAKAFLVFKGHHLFTEIWSEQPPLHTLLTAAAFHAFGPSVLTARILASLFGLLLVLTLYACVRTVAGRFAGLAAATWLYTASRNLDLFHGAMMEVPACAVALASSAVAMLSLRREHRLALAATSGALLAVAVQLKYTALLVGFVGGGVLASGGLFADGHSSHREALRGVAIWAGSFLVSFTLLSCVLPGMDYSSMAKALAVQPTDPDFGALSLRSLFAEQTLMLPAVGGLLVVAWRRRWEAGLPPLLLFATATVVHSLHRPFWGYYFIHLTIPAAWLCGLVVAELRATLAPAIRSGAWRRSWTSAAATGGALVSLAILACESGVEYVEAWHRLWDRPRLQSCASVQLVAKLCPENGYVFARNGSIAFAARRMTLPWLTVLSRRRYWSGQISDERVRAEVKRARPAVLMLGALEATESWTGLLRDGYSKAGEADGFVFYRADSAGQSPPVPH